LCWAFEQSLSTPSTAFAAGGLREHRSYLRTSNLSLKVDSRVQHAKKAGKEKGAMSCTVDAGSGVTAFGVFGGSDDINGSLYSLRLLSG
jgi:hypothetical protein